MSNLASITRPAVSNPSPRRPSLRVMAAPAPARRKVLAPALAALALLAALIYPIGVATQTAATTYQMKNIQIEVNKLTEENQLLRDKVALAKSPQSLEQKAREIGLVSSGSIGTISLESGEVSGGTPAQ